MDKNEIIIAIISTYFGVQKEVLLSGKSRKLADLYPRQITQYFLYYSCEENTYPSVARMFNCTHATVMSNVRIVQNLIDTDKKFCAMIQEIKLKIYGD